MNKRTMTKLAAVGTAGIIALAGCSAGDGSASENADQQDVALVENGDQQDVTLAVFNGWPEGEAVSYLWQHALEEQGYNVEMEYSDVVPGFVGLAGGDYDFNMDVWLPTTHAEYVEEYGDDIVDLGAWNEDATLNIAVNEDAPIDSLDELASNGDLFQNRLIGIEPGAGLTDITSNEVIPTYGLDDFEFPTSSTAAMLSELQAATDAGENIAVTLWHPHWAYDAFPIKDLEDPEGALGGAEGLHSFSRTGFDEDFPTLAGWLSDFTMETEPLDSLQNALFNSGADASEYPEIVDEWVTDNEELVDGLTA